MILRDPLTRLRGSLDSNDTFVSGGHGVIKTAGTTKHAERMTRIPVWALDDEKIKGYILFRFPNLKTDPEQRRRAARLVRIIHMYYRVGATGGAIAEELHMPESTVRQTVWRLEKYMKRPFKRQGRSKSVTLHATNGDEGDDSHITL